MAMSIRRVSIGGALIAALLSPASALAQPAPAPAKPPAPPTSATPRPPAAPPAPPPATPPAPRPPRPPAKPAKPPEPPPPALPEPDVHLSILAPTPDGPWTLRIDNEGTHTVRIPADARLLHITVEDGDTLAHKKAKPVTCELPAAMRPDGFPERRSLLLAPGESYTESFDPRMFCFGKNASALVGAALVRVRFGWDAPKQPAFTKNKKPSEGPFAVEGTEFPAVIAPLRALTAPPIVLSFKRIPRLKDKKPDAQRPDAPAADAQKPEAPRPDAQKPDAPIADAPRADASKDAKPDAPPPVHDENAGRLELTATPFAEASAPDRVSLTMTATNAGHRPLLAVIRPKMFAFRVDGPDGPVRCDAAPPAHAIPREMFRTVKPGGTVALTLLVAEACPITVFRRPGLYRVTPTLVANESGAELNLAAYTAVVSTHGPSFVRVHTGPEPYHRAPPRAVKIPKPVPSEDEDEDDGS